MRRESPLRLLVLDCDGVLVDSEVTANRILAEALTAEGYAVTPADCLRLFMGLSIASAIEMVESMTNTTPAR